MKKVSMSGSLRENVGKKDAKMHRKEGKVPCVLYGGKEQVHFVLDEKSFRKLLFSPDVYMSEITIGDQTYGAILQDVQYHPVTDHILHADFLELIPGKAIVASIPVKLEGVAPGVLKGGVLHKNTRKLRIKGMVEDFPEHISVDIGSLEIGMAVHVADIKTDHLEFLDRDNLVIASVRTSRIVVEAVEEEAAAEEASAEGAAEGATEGEAEAEKKGE